MKLDTGINGFGRFGIHLLKYWLDRNKEANFTIKAINEDTLSHDQVFEMICNDPYVHFNKYKVSKVADGFSILEPDGGKHHILFTHTPSKQIPWIGEYDLFLECSGKNTQKELCEPFLSGKTKLVAISATSWDCDKTLVYGFNHEEFEPSQKVISYGSCTVNAYTALADYIHKTFGIVDSDVNVVHNAAAHKIQDTLTRKFCTLEKSALQLLPYMNEQNFKVNYTVVPYTGASMIDFRFRLKEVSDLKTVTDNLLGAFEDGPLKGLYGTNEVDIGPEVINCTTFSTVFVKQGISMVGDNLYLPGYFDTENSVNRYFDLVDYISTNKF